MEKIHKLDQLSNNNRIKTEFTGIDRSLPRRHEWPRALLPVNQGRLLFLSYFHCFFIPSALSFHASDHAPCCQWIRGVCCFYPILFLHSLRTFFPNRNSDKFLFYFELRIGNISRGIQILFLRGSLRQQVNLAYLADKFGVQGNSMGLMGLLLWVPSHCDMGFNVERSLPTVLPLCRLETNVLQRYRISDPARSWTYFGHLRTCPLFRYLLSTLFSEVYEYTRSRPTNRLRASPYISAVTDFFPCYSFLRGTEKPDLTRRLEFGSLRNFPEKCGGTPSRPTDLRRTSSYYVPFARVSSPDFSMMLVGDR